MISKLAMAIAPIIAILTYGPIKKYFITLLPAGSFSEKHFANRGSARSEDVSGRTAISEE